jgi:spore coat polysaccharide biosynthesis predicted glycosyltransferase SpsG
MMYDYPDGVNHALQMGEDIVKISNGFGENQVILNISSEFKPDWLIMDLPYRDLDTSYFPILQTRGMKICFIDDFRFINPGADVFINSSILAAKRTKKTSGETARYFLGPAFFIFDEFSPGSVRLRKKNMRTVVLTFGASDPTGLTKKVVKTLLKDEWPQVIFWIILGPGNTDVDSVKKLVKGRERNFKIVVNPSNIISFFNGCDFVICAGGRTMYELLYMNKEFIPIATTEHEAEAIVEFTHRKLVDFGMTVWDSEKLIMNIKRIADRFHKSNGHLEHDDGRE